MAHAGAKSESDYVKEHCKGEFEVTLTDGTRCDCVTDTHAIEYDFGPKWAEAIVQSLWYAIQTGKKPGIVLILKKPDDYKFWIRLNTVLEKNHILIDTWMLDRRNP